MTTIYRVTDSQVMYGSTVQNIIHFKHGSSDPLTMQTLATEFRDSWINRVRSVQSGAIKHTVVQVRMLESQFATFNLTVNLDGTNSNSNEYKLTVAHIIRLRSALIGRHGRGRVYIGGLAFNLTQNGFLTTNILETWNTQLGHIMDVFGPAGSSEFRMVLIPRTNPQGFTDVTSLQMAPTEGSQRRRNVNVGI